MSSLSQLLNRVLFEKKIFAVGCAFSSISALVVTTSLVLVEWNDSLEREKQRVAISAQIIGDAAAEAVVLGDSKSGSETLRSVLAD